MYKLQCSKKNFKNCFIKQVLLLFLISIFIQTDIFADNQIVLVQNLLEEITRDNR